MPTLNLNSVYNAHKRKYLPELTLARVELEDFKASLVARFGKETADAVKMYTHPTEDFIFGRVEVPELPEDAEPAVKTMAQLIEQLTAVWKRIRSADCWFRESPVPISVLDTVGLSWDQVRARCSDDGWLPVSNVLWLLGVLRTTPQVMPTDELVFEWAGAGYDPCYLPHEWRQVLRGRKRRLVRLLGKAAEVEEEVRCEFG